MQEIWYDIDGYEGYYQWSSKFRFRSIDRTVTRSDGQKRVFKGKLLSVSKSAGYSAVGLTRHSITYHVHLHVFFAKKFIPNPENKKYVNHKNGDKMDYSLSNLEWATKGEDIKHAYRTGLRPYLKGEKSNFYGVNGDNHHMSKRKGGNHFNAKIVLDTQNGIYYDCVRDAAVSKNIKYGTLVSQLNGSDKNNTSFIYV